MTTDPLKRTLFQLSFPLFLQSLVMFAVMVADMMIWSAHAPQTAASLSVAGQVVRVAVEMSAVMGIGGVILVSQHLGRGDSRAAKLTAQTACMANIAVGSALTLAMLLGGPLILSLMTLEPALQASAVQYVRLMSFAMIFLCFGNTAVAMLRGYGRSRLVMVMGLFGALLYIALEYLLVLGPGGLPALGVPGAGLANLLTRVLIAAVLAVTVMRVLGLRLTLAPLRDQIPLIRRMIGLALPSVSDFIAYGFYQIVLIGVIATQGEIPLLARAYVMIAMAFLTLVIMAVVQGTEVMIGYRIGAGRPHEAWARGWQSSVIASVLSAACALLIWLNAARFVGLFTDDPAVIALARDLLWLTIFLQPCFAVNMVLFHALRAVEDVRWPVLVSQGLSWGAGLPLAWVLCVPAGMGVTGVWLAFLTEELAKSVAMGWRWSRHRHRPSDVVRDPL